MLDQGQRERVAARLLSLEESPADRSGRVVAIIAGMGAALVGAGLLYLVAYNWEALTKPVKLGLIFAVWGGLHFAGYWLTHSPGRYPRLGTALTAIGVLSFGGAIALIAQIYNLSAEYPWAMLLWAAFNLPLVLLSRSLLILTIVTGLFITWAFWHTGVYLEHLSRPTYWEERLFYAFLLLGLGLGAFLAAIAGQCSATGFDYFKGLLRTVARLLALGAIYALSFDTFDHLSSSSWADVGGEDWRSSMPRLMLPFAIVSAAAWLCMTARVSRPGGAAAQRTALLIAIAGLFFALHFVLAPQWMYLSANFALLAAVGLLIQGGLREGRALDINFGLLLFAVWLVSRYFEYLWDKLEAAGASIGLGVLLLAGGFFLEKRRKQWMASIKRGTP